VRSAYAAAVKLNTRPTAIVMMNVIIGTAGV